jgi:hypothetical protein
MKNGRISMAVLLLSICCILFSGCGHGKQPRMGKELVIGSDTVTQSIINRLVPDSLSQDRKKDRAELELFLAYSFPGFSGSNPDSRIKGDLAEQLSRISGDSWNAEAAGYLYSSAKVLICFLESTDKDSLLAKITGVYVNDSVVKRNIIERLVSIRNSNGKNVHPEKAVVELFYLNNDMARIVIEFVYTAEKACPSAKGNTSIKGLISNGIRSDAISTASHTTVSRSRPVVSAIVTDDVKEFLKYRSQQSIKDSIQKHIPDLEAMYKKYLKMHTDMAGTVWVTFEINTDGSVASAKVRTSQISEQDFLLPFHSYITTKIRFLPVPGRVGTMTVEFPFDFTPES